MQVDIHPQYEPTVFKCGCGSVFEVHSTLGGEQHIEVCGNCHPFFKGTGSKIIDSTGRIDKFKRRYQRA